MGASPQQKAMQAAQDSVAQAVKTAKKEAKRTVEGLESKVGGYRDLASESQQNIANILGPGQTPSEYYSRITSNFGELPSMPQQIATYQSQLNQGDYPVLGSPSHQRFEDTLARSADMYSQFAQRGLNEVQPRFAGLAMDPAFNLQRDPEAMKLAQGNLNKSQIQYLTTYNV